MKRTALVLAVVVVALLVAVGAAALAGEVGNPGGDEVGVSPTQLLTDGTMEPELA